MPPRHERQHRRRALSMESASSAAAAAASSPLAATAALRQQQRRTGYGNAWARPRRRLRRQERWRRRRRSWWRRRGAVVSPAAVAAVAPSAHASAATAGATGSTGTPISRRTSRSAGIRQERRHRPPPLSTYVFAPASVNSGSNSAPRQRLLPHRARPTASRQRGSRSREASGPGAPALRLHREAPGRMVCDRAHGAHKVRGASSVASCGQPRDVGALGGADQRLYTGAERGTDSDGGYSSNRGQNSQFLNFEFKVCWRGVRACDRRN